MTRTKMIARIAQDQRHQAARQAARVRAKSVAAVRPPRQQTGVKNIERRIRNRTFRIKRLLAQPKMLMTKDAVLLFEKWL